MNVFDYFFNENKSLDKQFILNEKDKMSYSELYRNSLKVASFINETVGEGKNIILVAHNSSFFVTVYLGILKSGNVCVPLNFNIEQSNLNLIVSLTDCDLVFATKQILSKISFDSVKNVNDEEGYSRIIKKEYLTTNFNEDFDQEKLAEIIFTSGSTGEPKGVMISHKNIMANTNSIIEYLSLNSNDIICAVLPLYYCYGLSLLHTHLKIGGSIVFNNTFMFLGTVVKDLLNYECTGFCGCSQSFSNAIKEIKLFQEYQFPEIKIRNTGRR